MSNGNTNPNPILSALTHTSFDLENKATDVGRLGEGLTALARLMTATDPQQTDGYNDRPILHGLGYLVEAVGAQFREHAAAIEARAVDVRVQQRCQTADADQ